MNKKQWFNTWWGATIIIVPILLLVSFFIAKSYSKYEETNYEIKKSIENSKNLNLEDYSEEQDTKTKDITKKESISNNEIKTYKQIFTFSGNGSKKSETFNIQGDKFKITYDCNGDPDGIYCGAFVYKADSGLPQVVMNNFSAITDETIIYTSIAGKGEYYIDANVFGNFSITVYDYK